MKSILGLYNSKIVNYTTSNIQTYQDGFDVNGFNDYQSKKESDYKLLEKFFKRKYKDSVKVTTDRYGVNISIKHDNIKGDVALSYSQDELVFVSQNTYINNYVKTAITTFNTGEWMEPIKDEQIDDLVEEFFSLSNYIRKYKVKSWVNLMIKVVEEKDFYEEFVNGMDTFTRITLFWRYTNKGLEVNHNDDKFLVYDDQLALEEDRLDIIKGLYEFINYVKAKNHKPVEDSILDTDTTIDGYTPTEEDDTYNILDDEVDVQDVDGEDDEIDCNDSDIIDHSHFNSDEVKYLEELKLSSELKEKDDKGPEIDELIDDDKGYQTVKIPDDGFTHPIQGTNYLNRMMLGMKRAIVVYTNGEKIADTLEYVKWDDERKDYYGAILDGVEQVNKKYALDNIDLVFDKDTTDVQVRYIHKDIETSLLLVDHAERKMQLGKDDDSILLLTNEKNYAQDIKEWFQTKEGW